ncbi:TetR/AcrR family transcriptional regulator [Glycomyces tritici]|uniref:Helix-turn-helix domain-containing protein n=1 Tax=Glycomyces tritici TaxID=2665176 RepID=A0ABT7YWQ1_9ACTN|nr:TetR/AcrR family transcriptional regulator [Glycomyces tritici]MDN3243071.1 helix-turn-helix domain-containing protein [Glycomyces tritici]
MAGRQDTAVTRDRILETARELFGANTYRASSMREIAARLGIAKPSLYHHFSSKAEILEQLLEAPIEALGAAVEAAAGEPDADEARRRLLRDCIAVMITHQDVMRLLLRDASIYSDDSMQLVGTVVATVDRATAILAGPGADWRRRLRAAQAFAAATDPVGRFPDAPVEALREALFLGAMAILDLD